MISITFAAPDFQKLRDDLAHRSLESAAILLAVPVKTRESDWRLIVREIHVAPADAYVQRTPINVTLKTDFCLQLEKRARLRNWSLVYVHTHPGQQKNTLAFSPIDDEAEYGLRDYLASRAISGPHATMVLGEAAVLGRELGRGEPARVVEVGSELRFLADPGEAQLIEDRFDRQIRAFGAEGQSRLADLSVAIVGLGGTGSLVAQELAHLGVGRFLLVDDDQIEATNLNRVVGATAGAIGMDKVVVAERATKSVNPGAVVEAIVGSALNDAVARRIADADFIFSCTDTHASRHVLNQLAHQYRVPLIDMGVGIGVAGATVSIAGHIKMVAPGLPCLWCLNNLDAAAVRREMMTKEQRAADPYFSQTVGVVQPAVISLNGTVASVAITMFLAAVVGVPSSPRYIIYDGNRGRMNGVEASVNPACNFCGPDSTSGWGDTYPLPTQANG